MGTPVWIKKDSERYEAFKKVVDVCGVSEEKVGLVLTESFKGFADAFSRPSMPEIRMGAFSFKPNKFKLMLRLLLMGFWLRHGLVNKLYYIYLTLPTRIKFDYIKRNESLNSVGRKNDALFIHKHYDRIMRQWLDDLKQYGEDNNIYMKIMRNFQSIRDVQKEFIEYKSKIIRRKK